MTARPDALEEAARVADTLADDVQAEISRLAHQHPEQDYQIRERNQMVMIRTFQRDSVRAAAQKIRALKDKATPASADAGEPVAWIRGIQNRAGAQWRDVTLTPDAAKVGLVVHGGSNSYLDGEVITVTSLYAKPVGGRAGITREAVIRLVEDFHAKNVIHAREGGRCERCNALADAVLRLVGEP